MKCYTKATKRIYVNHVRKFGGDLSPVRN